MNTFKKWCKFCANHEASQDCEEDIKEAAMSMFEVKKLHLKKQHTN